jgi:hypothetical protein
MSEYGEGDCCSVWQDRWLTARKPHRCHACRMTIEPGHRYHNTFSVYDGNADTTKRCARCQAIYEHLSKRMRAEPDPWENDEYCNPTLSCGHEYRERWNEDPPPEIAALAFWLPGDPLPDGTRG